MKTESKEEVIEAIYKMVDAINHISRGSVHSGPVGFELLSMAIEGEGGSPGQNPLSNAVRESGDSIATSINNLAASIDRIADKLSLPNPPITAPPSGGPVHPVVGQSQPIIGQDIHILRHSP